MSSSLSITLVGNSTSARSTLSLGTFPTMDLRVIIPVILFSSCFLYCQSPNVFVSHPISTASLTDSSSAIVISGELVLVFQCSLKGTFISSYTRYNMSLSVTIPMGSFEFSPVTTRTLKTSLSRITFAASPT